MSTFGNSHQCEGNNCWCHPIVVLTSREKRVAELAGTLPERYVVQDGLGGQPFIGVNHTIVEECLNVQTGPHTTNGFRPDASSQPE